MSFRYTPSVDFADRSNKSAKQLDDDYDRRKCKGKKHYGASIPTQAQYDYSMKHFGKSLCFDCQRGGE